MMDVRMPGMDGLEATRKIKAREGAPVVIMFTLEDSESVRAAAKAAGADDFVAKAARPNDALRAAIRRAFPGVRWHLRR
jgi:CheY-like chemotaxis protein